MCVGNDCCAPDPQGHLWLKHSHLWYDCCGLDDTGGMDHMGQDQIHVDRTTALCTDLSRIWISSSKKKGISPFACRVPISQTVQRPLEVFVNTSALSLLCCYLSSPSQKHILILHFCRDLCLSSFSCLGLQEIETEGLRPPARDFVSQCSGALYGWMMNTNLIILGSAGWVFFC